jgi:hypothetical protein
MQAGSARLFARAAAGDTAALRATAQELDGIVAAHELDFYAAWADTIDGSESDRPLQAAAALVALTALEALLRVQEIDAFAALLPVYDRVSLPAADKSHALAEMYFRRGFLESAADEWIAAFERSPEARFLVALAQVAVAQELPSDAVELATGALELDPGNAVALRLLDVLGTRGKAAA